MMDEHTPTLQQIAADRDWWSADAGKHYRELAHWLRGIAAKCRLPYTQKELLDLARRYDTRAALTFAGRRGVPAGGLLGMVRLSDLGISKHY
jgi:hypothetical protein